MTIIEFLEAEKKRLVLQKRSINKLKIKRLRVYIKKLKQYRGVEYIDDRPTGLLFNLIISPTTKE